MSVALKGTNLNLKDKGFDYLKSLELQLKEVWSQYVKCLDEQGFSDSTKSLRDKYFKIYQSYQNNKKWREIVGN